jgi:hypothetical protein
MEINPKLPKEINDKIFLYMSHPVADIMHPVIIDAENYFGYEGQRSYPSMILLNRAIYCTDEYPNERMRTGGAHSTRRW